MPVSYKTAFRWWKAGRLDAYQQDTGTIIVRDPLPDADLAKGITLYARVSMQGQKAGLDRQVEQLKTYAVMNPMAKARGLLLSLRTDLMASRSATG
jgi:putative resolvase